MDPVSVLPAVAVLVVAVLTMWLWLRLAGPSGFESGGGRFSTIDGLRGYLALLVFLHHACFWYFYLQTGEWKMLPSNLYTNFGDGGVALFFMVTGFLFFSKLIQSAGGRIDWQRLFVSRLLRLVPLYLFAVAVVFILVALVSGGVLHEPVLKLLAGAVFWLGLGILPTPDLNGVNQSWIMVAGVTWSLRYEWLFYLALPACALLFRIDVPKGYRLVGLLGLLGLIVSSVASGRIHCPTLFASGAAAAFLVRSPWFRRVSMGWLSSCVVAALLSVAFVAFKTVNQLLPIVLVAIAFSMMASGNNLFGLLSHRVSRALGELAYSIYLLHGLLLFIGLKMLVGVEAVRGLSADQYWGLVVAMVPVVVICSIFTFRYIEKPAMGAVDATVAAVRRRLAGRAQVR